jgi:poly-gamma-glutamate capsule biosynthesis protein CapA/YwtB (metallophosphatase superfamily)
MKKTAMIILLAISARAEETSIRIVCTGDIMAGGALTGLLDAKGMDFPYARLKPLLAGADHVVGNLECPVTRRGTPWAGKKYTYRTAPRHAGVLTAGGFHTVTLANNHAMDFGPEGVEDTLKNLDAAKIRHTGAAMSESAAKEPVEVTLGGKTFIFLAFAYTYPLESHAKGAKPGTYFASVPSITRETARARKKADRVIVFIHAGVEYEHKVHPDQRLLARAAVDAGADAVVGHHPHVLQEIEEYRGKPIVYSLGNFVFGTDNPKAEGAVLGLAFSPEGKISADLTVLEVNNRLVAYQPVPLAGDDLTRALRRSFGRTLGGWRRDGDKLLWP